MSNCLLWRGGYCACNRLSSPCAALLNHKPPMQHWISITASRSGPLGELSSRMNFCIESNGAYATLQCWRKLFFYNFCSVRTTDASPIVFDNTPIRLLLPKWNGFAHISCLSLVLAQRLNKSRTENHSTWVSPRLQQHYKTKSSIARVVVVVVYYKL